MRTVLSALTVRSPFFSAHLQHIAPLEDSVRNRAIYATRCPIKDGSDVARPAQAHTAHPNWRFLTHAHTNTLFPSAPAHTSLLQICGLNAFGYAYGVLISTYGLITLPMEAERMYPSNHALLLALFLGLAGVSQLSGPMAGYFSDRCTHRWGRRRPFLVYGGAVGVMCVLVQWYVHYLQLRVYGICTVYGHNVSKGAAESAANDARRCTLRSWAHGSSVSARSTNASR